MPDLIHLHAPSEKALDAALQAHWGPGVIVCDTLRQAMRRAIAAAYRANAAERRTAVEGAPVIGIAPPIQLQPSMETVA